jgi:hypothetical protein
MISLFMQLNQIIMPEIAAGNLLLSFQALQRSAVGNRYCVVLDDIWSGDVESQLDFLDETTQSVLLVSGAQESKV